jgi:hypothetical protein
MNAEIADFFSLNQRASAFSPAHAGGAWVSVQRAFCKVINFVD